MKITNDNYDNMISTYIHLAKALSAKDGSNSCPILANVKPIIEKLEMTSSEEERNKLATELVKTFRLKLDETEDLIKDHSNIHENYLNFAKGLISYDKTKSCPLTKKLTPILQTLENNNCEEDRLKLEGSVVSTLRLKDDSDTIVNTTQDLSKLDFIGAEEVLKEFS
ncbi:MAG: hypothetical protein K0Q51_500 [Rickettsiaceae bacterium]|jgi:hypothetical protein|nr:hypothetical protein [Rickettsiaceae bacterium]